MNLGPAGDYREIEPLLRRMVDLDAAVLVRIRRDGDQLTALVRTPFSVLAARSVRLPALNATTAPATAVDVTLGAADLLAWTAAGAAAGEPPAARDAEWRWALPPRTGWQRLDQVPDDVIRSLVRSGALTLKEAAAREGVPGAQPRQEVADALLDSVVLTVTGAETSGVDQPVPSPGVAITLRVLSALTRLGFLARGSHAAIDRSGRWARVAGTYGTVYLETSPGLSVLR